MKQVAFITDDWDREAQGGFEPHFAVQLAAADHDAKVKTIDRFSVEESVLQRLWHLLEESDLIIVNITHNSPSLIYEIGLAHGLGKPVLIMTNQEVVKLPADLSGQFVVVYKNDREALARLKFKLSNLMHDVLYEKKSLRMLWGPREANISPQVSDRCVKLEFREILSLKGLPQIRQLQNWVFELADGVPDWEVFRASETESEAEKGYDLVLWNSLADPDLTLLGNPIPIALEVTKTLRREVLKTLSRQARLQGLKGVILGTTAKATEGNKGWVKELSMSENLIIILLDSDDLLSVKSSKDLVDKIKSKLLDLIYS